MSAGQAEPPPSLESVTSALYAGPYDDFTSRRNEAARHLKAGGRRELAADVMKLRRPPLPVWAVNQLARRQSDEVQALLAAGAALRGAQAGALGGRDRAAAEFREAAETERKAVEALVRRAAGLLTMTGHAAGEPVLARVRQTLHSAATADDDVREALGSGRLTSELGPAGFGSFAEIGVAPRRPGRTAEPPSRAQEKAIAEIAELRAEADERERIADRARAVAEELRGEADRLAGQAEEAHRRALDAEHAARQAERESRRAREAVDRAAARGRP